MRKMIFGLIIISSLIACGEGSGATNEADSVSTDSIPDPSYNPKVESDSGAKQMNLDSTQIETGN